MFPSCRSGFNLGFRQVQQCVDRAVRSKCCCLSSLYYIKSGSRQNDRLPQEMTPVTEGSAANLQASFCLNSLSPCRQILIFSVTASFPPLCCSPRFCFAHKMQFLQHLSSSTPHAPPAKPVFSGLKKNAPTYIYLLKEFYLFFYSCHFWWFTNKHIVLTFWLWIRKSCCLETTVHEKMRFSCSNVFTFQTKAPFIYIEICLS